MNWAFPRAGRAIARARAGFTLIELLVVMVILGIIFGVAIPSISRYFGVSIQSTTREIATAIRDAFNGAVVTGRVYRVVYDFSKNTYWVETGQPGALIETDESRKADEKRGRRRKKSDDKNAAKEDGFLLAKAITRKAIALPRGVSFDDVRTQASSEPVTSGRAYTHFFPHGIAEQTLVHLKDDSDHKITLAIHPTNGQTDVYPRYVTPEEAFGN